MLVCEAAGYDVVMVETVGIGQSETAVADMTDFFLVLMLPGRRRRIAGPQEGHCRTRRHDRGQQGRRRQYRPRQAGGGGISRRAQYSHTTLGDLVTAGITYSALTGNGIAELWTQVLEHIREKMTASGELAARRREQQVKWMWTMLEERLTARLRSDASVRAKLRQAEAQVAAGKLAPTLAVEEIAKLLGV